VRSARYAADAGFSSTGDIDRDNNLLLIKKLSSTAEATRTARYRCVLALANSGEVVLTAAGEVEGRIVLEPRGNGGFGYDPLFYLPDLGLTMSEIDLETKNSLSHRGRAMRALLNQINELLN
jgi:XTP/dITP diphosphohydrolase